MGELSAANACACRREDGQRLTELVEEDMVVVIFTELVEFVMPL